MLEGFLAYADASLTEQETANVVQGELFAFAAWKPMKDKLKLQEAKAVQGVRGAEVKTGDS